VSEAIGPTSGGGAATLGGTTFQEDVACYLSTLILAEASAEPLAGLPQDVYLTAIVSEAPQPIDDLLIGTSEGGALYVQAKTALDRSQAADSAFAKVIDQFVRQRLLGARPIGTEPRPLDHARDRFILAVGHDTPATITSSLPNVLEKCRPITDSARLKELLRSLNATEAKTLEITRAHIQRSWLAKTGTSPSAQDELSLIQLMRVLQLDLRTDGSALLRAKDLLRQVVLTNPGRSGDAWSALITICRSFGPNKTGGDLAFLRAELQNRRIPIRSVPSYAGDIEALVKYTSDRLTFLRRLSVMELGGKDVKIRREVIVPLFEFSAKDHTVLVGEPGAGKSGCVHDLAQHLIDDGNDVVLLAADTIKASSANELSASLGLARTRTLVDILQRWSGERPAFLLVDALDAARSGMSLNVLCEIFRELRERAPRWHIVASIREYDLRTSPEVQELFAGSPHLQFCDSRFPMVRHIRVSRLSAAELSQVTAGHPRMLGLLQSAPTLAELVRNPFNLNLLCTLLDNNVSDADLTAVQQQIELLDLHWTRRVEASDRAGRQVVLTAAVRQMVTARELNVQRIPLAMAVAANAASLESLLSIGVLVELAPRSRADALISFAHNILFDYAVCRLWLNGLSDSQISQLSEPANHDLLLAIRPSIKMAFEELWFEGPMRCAFWERAIAFERPPQMRLIGKIIAAGVAAERYETLSDVQPVLDGLRQKDASAKALLRFMIQAALTQQEPGPTQRLMLGDGAPEWMALASALSEHLDQVAWDTRSLLSPIARGAETATKDQCRAANTTAVALLKFGLADSRYYGLVRLAIEVCAETITADPNSTVQSLAEVLRPDKLEVGAHEWLHPLAERLHLIAEVDPTFAVQVVEVVFNASGDPDASVPLGSRILPMSMNKRDLVRMARHDVKTAVGALWSIDPVTATRIVLSVMTATMSEEHANLTEPKNTYHIPFRGATATLKPDASHIWTAGSHHQHDDWYQVLSVFRLGISTLAKDDGQALLGQVLDVLRDECAWAVVWSTLLGAAAEQPESLAGPVSELLEAPEVLREMDTRTNAGELIERGFAFLSVERRLAIETAIIRIPEITPPEMQEFAEHTRNRMIGCIPVDLIQSTELRVIRAQLDEAGGPPPNTPDFSISFSSTGEEDQWWLRRKGVDPSNPSNAAMLELSKAVVGICADRRSHDPSRDEASQLLSLLRDAERVVRTDHNQGVHQAVVEQLEDEIIAACTRLVLAGRLLSDAPVKLFARTILLRGATSPRPPYREEDNEQWDRDNAGWGSPAARIESARGLVHLASDSTTVDEEILGTLRRLATDPVPAVRYQVLVHSGWLYKSASELMWSLIEYACVNEPRTAILTHFSSNVLLRMPFRDYERIEPYVRTLYKRCRSKASMRSVRRYCANFYAIHALWNRNSRAIRYIRVFAANPGHFPLESNTVIGLCRDLIRYRDNATPGENERVRRSAFEFLTAVVEAIQTRTQSLRQQYESKPFDQWSKDDLDELRELHALAHGVATEVYIGSGASEHRRASTDRSGEYHPPTDQEKTELLNEGRELFDSLCNVEFVETAYEVLKTLEFLIGADNREVILRVASLVRGAESDGIQYESMAADLVVRIVERYFSEYGSLFREDADARAALIDILDVFVGAGWPKATRLTYRLGEVFR